MQWFRTRTKDYVDPREPLRDEGPFTVPKHRQPETADERLKQTNRLNAESIRLVAEANELRGRQLGQLEQISNWLQRDLENKAERLQQIDQQLVEREAKVQEAERLYKEGVQLKEQAVAQSLDNQRTLDEGKRRIEAAEKAELLSKEAQENSQEAAKCILAQFEKLQAQLWPTGLRGEDWHSWRDQVISRAGTDHPTSILLARLHGAAALERSGRTLTMELLPAVSEFVTSKQGINTLQGRGRGNGAGSP